MTIADTDVHTHGEPWKFPYTKKATKINAGQTS